MKSLLERSSLKGIVPWTIVIVKLSPQHHLSFYKHQQNQKLVILCQVEFLMLISS